MKTTDTVPDAPGKARKEMSLLRLCIYLILGGTVLPLITLSSSFYSDMQAAKTREIMKAWQQVDAENLWNEIGALVANTQPTSLRKLSKQELPKLLQEAGFKSATCTSLKFKATHGGSSFGVAPAVVLYEHEPMGLDDNSRAPVLRTSGGNYDQRNGWQPR